MMFPHLPAELWTTIVKHAITVWPNASFNLLADDFDSVEGFSNASTFTRGIVDKLRHENVILQDYDDFVFLWIPCQSVRHMRINETLSSRQMFTNCFYHTLSDYNQLESLSLCSPEPAFTYSKLPDLSFAATLRRLDLRCMPEHCKTFWEAVTVGFPHLVELRLGASEFLESGPSLSNRNRPVRKDVYADVETFATSIASRLSLSPNLRFLSLHIPLSDMKPDDGFFGFFTAKMTSQNENAATLILAQVLSNLEVVCWAYQWIDEDYKPTSREPIQRNARIVRCDDGGIEVMKENQDHSAAFPSAVEH